MRKYGNFSRFTVLVGLSACLCPAPAQADTWVTPGTLRPNYMVEAVRFHCNDETGNDWWGSDEIRVGISTPSTTTISKVFGDVDSGETRSFAPDQSCIYPIDGQSFNGDGLFEPSETWSCSNAGSPGPISFTLVMAEEDSGFFHDCLGDFDPDCEFFSDQSVPDSNDDLIARRKVEFTPEQLAFAMPQVGISIEPVITLGGPYPATAEYTFTYRITRVAPGPLLSDRGAQIAVPMR